MTGCTVIVNVPYAPHWRRDVECGRPATSCLLIRKAFPAGTAPQYDVECVCDLHLRDYGRRLEEGLAEVLTEEEALVAEVMLS